MADDGPEVQAAKKLGYRPELDGLRAIAVIGVMAAHLYGGGWAGGATGVYFFFVLSGFLITRLLLEEHHANGRLALTSFWMRRGARLLPAAVAFVGATVLWAKFVIGGAVGEATADQAPSVLLYVANWHTQMTGRPPSMLEHSWSLSVEEQFYLAWPLALILLMRLGASWNRIGWIVGVGSLVLVTANRLWLYEPGAVAPQGWRTDFIADLLFVGCAAAFISFQRRLVIPRWLLAIALLVIGSRVVLRGLGDSSLSGFLTTWGVGLFAVAASVLVLHVVAAPNRVLSWRPLVTVGRCSYSLYLWHILGYSVGVHLGMHPVVKVALATLLAGVSYVWLERPARSWLNARIERRSGDLHHAADEKLVPRSPRPRDRRRDHGVEYDEHLGRAGAALG